MVRILVKLSGEVLKGSLRAGIDWTVVDALCSEIAGAIKNTKAELGFVIGGGNIFRGATPDLNIRNYNRLLGDSMGMMATVINALALTERLRGNGVNAILQSGVQIDGIAPLFNADVVEHNFKNGGVVVFAGGIGSPYFSTDMTAALRSLQIRADFLAKATKVDGVYNCDPMKYADAKRYDKISYNEIIEKKLEVLDLTAIQLLEKNNMKLLVYNMTQKGNLEAICRGEQIGTIVE
ncbi:MAG: UMP kinase [Spirochaetales bacterium]|nr:UMP kinase [Spirochaetales bacterium]